MSEPLMSIAAGAWSEQHRNMKVEKVENGYVVIVKVTRERPDYEGVKRPQAGDERYVAKTLDEVLGMVRSYFA